MTNHLLQALREIREQCDGLLSHDDYKGAIYDIKRIADSALNRTPSVEPSQTSLDLGDRAAFNPASVLPPPCSQLHGNDENEIQNTS